MEELTYSHNVWLVAASLLVALIAGFTGLSLTKGLSKRNVLQKKVAIAMAAVALGGGIWSMHFVAMLGLQMPVLFYYDAVVTLISALVAILMVGIALLLLHFWQRTPRILVASGVIVGLGILAMHYIGMAGLQLCRALYTPSGIVFSVIASCGLSVLAFWVAYGQRTDRNIILGTICFGLAVFAVHFVAIFGTRFVPVEALREVGPVISNEVMALGVVISSFLLCAAFLLTGITFLQSATPVGADVATSPTPAMKTDAEESDPLVPRHKAQAEHIGSRQIPYEKDGKTHFLPPDRVAAIRAEGHYTLLYTPEHKHFCLWSMSEAEKRLVPAAFLKTHRSYLINPSFVGSFEKLKDSGVCHLEVSGLSKVPVSRSRLKDVRAALGV